MGHDVIGMEQYVAESSKPLARCLSDVQASDLYVVVLGWRYGHRPEDAVANPQALSITELEFQAARTSSKPILAFLLDPEAPWPPSELDALSTDADAAANTARFRSDVGAAYLAGVFRTPEDLASQVAAAVAAQGLGQQLVDRLLRQSDVTAEDMGHFGRGAQLADTTLIGVKEMVRVSGPVRAVLVNLGNGDQWWSTRLFLLANLLRRLTAVRQCVFKDASGCFAGMASPSAVVDGLASVFPVLDEFRRATAGNGTQDTDREIDRHTTIWKQQLGSQDEQTIKVGVRSELLQGWLGQRLIGRCIRVDSNGPTMVQVQQIVDSLVPDVPLERWDSPSSSPPKPTLQVVDRDAFALELARSWVRTGLPRTRSASLVRCSGQALPHGQSGQRNAATGTSSVTISRSNVP